MAQTTLVTRKIDAGRRLIQSLRADGFAVAVAFWLKTDEDDTWRLYIATPEIDQLGFRGAYSRVSEIAQKHQLSGIDQFDVRLIETDSQLAQAVLSRQAQWPAPLDTVIRGTSLGATTVDEGLVYAPSSVAS